MDDLVLLTKISMPNPRENYIIRQDLFTRLDESYKTKLIYIEGSAGVGKSSLIQTYFIEKKIKNYAWLNLDSKQNDIVSFWQYIIYALSSCGEDVLDLVEMLNLNYSKENLYNIIISIINIISNKEKFYLVLDDAEKIENKMVLNSIDFFLENIGPSITLVVLSRTSPKIYVSKLAIKGELLYLENKDLLFSSSEAESFLNLSLNKSINSDMLDKIIKKAEGWVSGLSFLTISNNYELSLLKNDKFTIDYFLHEIYNKRDKDEKEFLLKSAVLPVFDKRTYNLVYKEDDIFDSIIETLLEDNLFITCIDTNKKIYKYHAMMEDFLLREFSFKDTEEKNEIYNLCADVFFSKRDYNTAFDYYLKANNYNKCLDVLEYIKDGMFKWSLLNNLPIEIIAKNINYVVSVMMYNITYINTAKYLAIFNYLADNNLYVDLLGFLKFDTSRFIKYNVDFLPKIIDQETMKKYNISKSIQSVLLFNNAAILFNNCEYQEALLSTAQAIELSTITNNMFARFYSLNTIAQIHEEIGEIKKALDCYDKIKEEIAFNKYPKSMLYSFYIGLVGIYYRMNEKDAAKEVLNLIERELISTIDDPVIILAGFDFHMLEYDVLYNQELVTDESIEHVLINRKGAKLDYFSRLLYELEARNILPNELKEEFISEVIDISELSISSKILYARLVSEKNPSLSKNLIEELLIFSREKHNYLSLVKTNILKIVISKEIITRNNIDLFLEAIYYGCLNGIDLPFYIDREKLLPLVNHIIKNNKEKLNNENIDFINKNILINDKVMRIKECLLTKRELEVLLEMQKGLTNIEIAENLYISKSTLKTHINNIYSKLNCKNKVEAINIAKEKQILKNI